VGFGTSAAALVEQDDAVTAGVEKLPVPRFAAGTGAAVQEHHGHTVRVAAFFDVNFVQLIGLQVEMPIFVDGWVKGAQCDLLNIPVLQPFLGMMASFCQNWNCGRYTVMFGVVHP
jgi:hypothetical protein